MKKRYFKARPKSLPKGYDSKLEQRLHETCLQSCQHHVPKEDLIPYTVEHTYEPDFLLEYERKLFVYEVKGRFRDSTESAKYKWIRNNLNNWQYFKNSTCAEIELVLIFENAATPMPFSKRRKDGTRQSHGEWATKNGFRWLCEKRGDLNGIESPEELVNKLEALNANK